MRTLLALLAAALFVSAGFAQSPFFFTQSSPQDMTAMATTIRTIVDIQDLSIDQAHRSLVAHATEDKLLLADWLFHQLDKPAGQSHAGPPPEYKMPGQNADIVKVLYTSPSAAISDITAAVTAIRTVADLQRLFPYESQKAIVARGSAEKVAAAEWLVRQLCPPEGSAPTADSPVFPAAAIVTREPDPEIRVFRMDPDISNAGLTATVTAIRTVADLQRLFPYESGKAIIASGAADKIATAEWIVHARSKSADPQAVYQSTLAGETVRLYFLDPQKTSADVTALVTQIRTKAGVQRVFPFGDRPAIILRAPAAQIPIVEAMLAEGAPVH